MQPITYNVKVDLITGVTLPRIEFTKGDIGTSRIIFSIFSNNEPVTLSDKVVTITIKKSDNVNVVYDIPLANIHDDNMADFYPDSNALNVPGTVLFTLELYDGSSRITSKRMQYTVTDSLNIDDDVTSFKDYPMLVRLINDVKSLDIKENERQQADLIRESNEEVRNNNELVRQQRETDRITEVNSIKTAYDSATKANTVIELMDARKGEVNLRAKIDKIDSELNEKTKYPTMYFINNIETLNVEDIILTTSFYDDLKLNGVGTYIVKNADNANDGTFYDTGLGFFISDKGYLKLNVTSSKKLIPLLVNNTISTACLGSKGNGEDISRILQGALNLSVQHNVIVPNGNYNLVNTVVKPAMVNLDCGNSWFYVPANYNYINGYMFLINTKDGINTLVQGNNYGKENQVRNVKMGNPSKYNVSGIFSMCTNEFYNVTGDNLLQIIVWDGVNTPSGATGGYYDNLYVHGVVITNPLSNTLFPIEKKCFGDNTRIEKVTFYTSNGSSYWRAIRLKDTMNFKIDSIINGKIELENCQGKIINPHIEIGSINTINSQVSIEEGFIYRTDDPNYIPITIDTNSNYNLRSPVTLKNVTIYYSVYGHNYNSDMYDIALGDSSSVTLENVYRGFIQNTVDTTYFKNRALCGVKLSLNGADFSQFNKSSSAYSMFCIIQHGNIANEIASYVSKNSATVFTSANVEYRSGMAWKETIGDYYYSAEILLDVDKFLGRTNVTTTERHATLTDTTKCVGLSFEYGARYTNVIIRLYRGTVSGSYDKYMDIPVNVTMGSNNLFTFIDDGIQICGYTWKSRTAGTRDSVNYCNYVQKLIDGSVIAKCSGVPTLGTWNVGDKVINNTPTVGQPKSWINTVAGSPGTFVSEGNL